MARYNKKVTEATGTLTHEGGTGHTMSPELELISLLATSTLQERFYESITDQEKRLQKLIKQVAEKDPELVAKMLVYIRSKFGNRTVTHKGTVELTPYLSGKSSAAKFFSKRNRQEETGGIIFRLDDMMEILACYIAKNNNNVIDFKIKPTNAMKKGFAKAIEASDTYELAKYKMSNSAISLVDVMNITHPDPRLSKAEWISVDRKDYEEALKGTRFVNKDSNPEKLFTAKKLTHDTDKILLHPFIALILGLLKQFKTAENEQSKAGQEVAAKLKAGEITKAEADVELKEKKAENWKELIRNKRLGYFALLRNLRNILEDGDNKLVEIAARMLTNKSLIHSPSNLVWPHQIWTAWQEIMKEEGSNARTLLEAIEEAYDESTLNLIDLGFQGKTIVVIDSSGSMEVIWEMDYNLEVLKKSGISGQFPPIKAAALMGATLAKGTGADLYHFADSCVHVQYSPNQTSIGIASNYYNLVGNVGHGTNFKSIFNTIGPCDRLFILSDMQNGDSLDYVSSNLNAYKSRTGSNPYIYLVNLCGYSTSALPEQHEKTFHLAGWGSHLYTLIGKVEISPNELLEEAKAIII